MFLMITSKTKKAIVIAIVSIALLFGIFIAGYICIQSWIPRGGAVIAGTIVDNDYNNYLSNGNLVRIGDTLYYNYVRSPFAYGLMEISESGSKRIYWEGLKSGYYRVSFPLRQCDGQLLMAPDEQTLFYSRKTKKFELYTAPSPIESLPICYQKSDDKIIYLVRDNPESPQNERRRILLYQDGAITELAAAPAIYTFYMVGNDVYYLIQLDYEEFEFRKYNLLDKTDISIRKLYCYTEVYNFIIEGDYLVFAGCNELQNYAPYSIFKFNLNSSDKTVETVQSGKPHASDYMFDITAFNAFNGHIYVASMFGLTAYDVVTNESQRLYDGYVEECYIVDDTWVYFVNDNAELWRIPQIGGTAEKVYG